MLEAIRDLYAYSAWANTRILDTAAQLNPEQYTAASDGCDSIRNTLVHTASAQWLWLERWRENSPRGLWDPADFHDVAALRTRWVEVEEATSAYIATLRESDLERVVSYVNFQGETWAYPLWQQLLHQVNHATQHRSEAALLLTRLGYSPGWLDFLIYVDERDGQTARGVGQSVSRKTANFLPFLIPRKFRKFRKFDPSPTTRPKADS